MKNLLAASVLSLALSSSAYANDSVTYGNWMYMEGDNTLNSMTYVAATSSTNVEGIVVFIEFGTRFNCDPLLKVVLPYDPSDSKGKTDGVYEMKNPMSLKVDNKPALNFEKAYYAYGEELLTVIVSPPREFVHGLAYGKTLRINVGTSKLNFSLKGSKDSNIRAALTCTDALEVVGKTEVGSSSSSSSSKDEEFFAE